MCAIQCLPVHLVAVFRQAALKIYYTSGFDTKQIGWQNLRSGGAVNLKITGYDRDVTKNCAETEMTHRVPFTNYMTELMFTELSISTKCRKFSGYPRIVDT